MTARLSDRERIMRTVPESAFQSQTFELLARYEFDYWYHTHDSRKSRRGWPDVVAVRVRDERTVYMELKRRGERASDEQLIVMTLLHDAGEEVYLLDIDDWDFMQSVFWPPWWEERIWPQTG